MTKLCRFSGEQCFDRFLVYWQYLASEYLPDFTEVSLMTLLQSREACYFHFIHGDWNLKMLRLRESITEREINSDTLFTTLSTETYSSLLHPNYTNLKLNSLPSACICHPLTSNYLIQVYFTLHLPKHCLCLPCLEFQCCDM